MNRNILRLTTDGKLTIHEFPEGGYGCVHTELCDLIGNGCDTLESVKPNRLYSVFHYQNRPSRKHPGESVCMLVDEEGLLKENSVNVVGSWLYETDLHGNPIVGNILFVGECIESDGGIDFCGIEDINGMTLFLQLSDVIDKMKKIDTEGVFAK